MDILVINLDRSTDRLREFERTNPHLKHATRFPAVDGKTISRDDLLNQKIFEEPIFYTDGAIGNALSHFNAWEKAAKNQSPTTILEDDAIVHKDFETLAPPLIAILPADWDIVLWGWNFDTVMSYDAFADIPCVTRFSQTDMRKNLESLQTNAVKPSLHRLHYALGTIGYAVSPAGAKKLAALATPIKPFLYRIPALDLEIQNEAMDCVMASLHDRLNAYVSFPPLVFTRNDRTRSTVLHTAAEEAERSYKLMPTDFANSRKFKKKRARSLFAKGDIGGGMRCYLKYICTNKKAGS